MGRRKDKRSGNEGVQYENREMKGGIISQEE